MVKLKSIEEAIMFILGSVGVVALAVLVLHLLSGCSIAPISPDSSYEACSAYCSGQHKIPAYAIIYNGVAIKWCRCYNNLEDMINDI